MAKIHRTLTLVMFLSSAVVAHGQPDWTVQSTRSATYPESQYLVGFISERNTRGEDENELLRRLETYAKTQLAENLQVDIKSISTLELSNINSVSREAFQQSSTSFSQAQIAGLKTETYYDRRKAIGYALAYAAKANVIDLYHNSIGTEISRVEENLDLARQHFRSGNMQGALKHYFSCQTSFRNIESSQTLLVTLTSDFEDPALQAEKVKSLKLAVSSGLNEVSATDGFSIEEASFFMVSAMKTQAIKSDKPISLANFTYQDTPMGSPFSRRLRASLEQKLSENGYSVIAHQSADQDAYILTGTYWEANDKLKLTAILREFTTQMSVASMECYLPVADLTAKNIAFQPENYRNAFANMRLLAENEIKGGELQVDIYTNKGKENLIFTKGETLKLFIKANRECYIRFIYHLADGTRVLLLDNYYMDTEKVNVAYELPYEFECDEPFGVETLQVNAQSSPFEPLATHEEYGYDFILEDLGELVLKTRGIKRKKTGAEELKAEKRVVITTMRY